MNNGQEKRINEKLISYWDAKRGARAFPLESEINPEEIADIWPSCFLVRVDAEWTDAIGSEFKYVYLGQSLIDAYGDDLGNKQVCEKLAYPSNQVLIARFKDIVAQPQVLREESEFNNINHMLIKFRSCLLPLGRSQGQVGFILGGMKWKAF